MEQLIDSLSRTEDGAFIIDEGSRIVFWNRAAKAILGFTSSEAHGRLCYEILGGRDEQGRTLCHRFCRIAALAERGHALPNTDVYCHTLSGDGRWLNVTTFSYLDRDTAENRRIVHLFRDVTKKKEQEHFVASVLEASELLRSNNGFQIGSAAAAVPQNGDLTAREQEVLELLALGLDTAGISRRLVISPATLRNHVQNILGKLGVHSRLEAVAHAYQLGLIAIDNQ